MIDTRARLFFYTELQRHVRLRVWIGGLRGFDLSDTHDRAFRVAANILMFCFLIFCDISRRVCDTGVRCLRSRHSHLQALSGQLICGASRWPHFLELVPDVIRTVEELH